MRTAWLALIAMLTTGRGETPLGRATPTTRGNRIAMGSTHTYPAQRQEPWGQNDEGYMEGDMKLNSHQLSSIVGDPSHTGKQENTRPDNALIGSNYLWPQNTISYELDKGIHLAQRKVIEAAIEGLRQELAPCIQIQNTTSGNRVLITNEADGCWSEVGYQNKTTQGMNLQTNGCTYKGTVQHEFLHTLGLYHHQSRSDRDKYVQILWNNIPDKKKHNFEKYDSSKVDNHEIPYDYDSVMHYGGTDFGIGGRMTVRTRDPSKQKRIGQRRGLTKADAYLVKVMYKCEEGPRKARHRATKTKAWTRRGEARQHFSAVADLHHGKPARPWRPIWVKTRGWAYLPAATKFTQNGITKNDRCCKRMAFDYAYRSQDTWTLHTGETLVIFAQLTATVGATAIKHVQTNRTCELNRDYTKRSMPAFQHTKGTITEAPTVGFNRYHHLGLYTFDNCNSLKHRTSQIGDPHFYSTGFAIHSMTTEDQGTWTVRVRKYAARQNKSIGPMIEFNMTVLLPEVPQCSSNSADDYGSDNERRQHSSGHHKGMETQEDVHPPTTATLATAALWIMTMTATAVFTTATLTWTMYCYNARARRQQTREHN